MALFYHNYAILSTVNTMQIEIGGNPHESSQADRASKFPAHAADGHTERLAYADAAMVIFRPAIRGYEFGREGDVHLSPEPLPTFTAQRLGERCRRGICDLPPQGAGEGASHL